MGSYTGFIAIIILGLLSSSAGFYIASRKPEWYSNDRLNLLSAFSSGLLFSFIIAVMLPHSLNTDNYLFASLLIVSGFVGILLIETYIAPKLNFFEGDSCSHDHATENIHKDHPAEAHHHHLISHQAACSAVGCLIVCSFFDGFEIQTAFSLDAQTGWTTFFALLFHALPDGVLASSIAISGGIKKNKVLIISALTGGVLILGGLTSFVINKSLGVEKHMLAFATGVLIYVTFFHLLAMGLKHKKGIPVMAVTAVSYLALQFFLHN